MAVEEGKWLVKLRRSGSECAPVEFEDQCDLILYNKGVLNTYKWPEILGMDKFKGKFMHTARWPAGYQQSQWANERVAVLGSGASAIQVVPAMQPYVKSMDVYVRTAIWFSQISEEFAQNHEYSKEEKDEFRKNPENLIAHAKTLDSFYNRFMPAFYKDSPGASMLRRVFEERMAEHISDESLVKGFTPSFGVGCKSLALSDKLSIDLILDRPSCHTWRSVHESRPREQH